MRDTLRGRDPGGPSTAERIVGSDEDLLRRIARGDAAGFADLVQRYGPTAHAVARSLLAPSLAAAAVEKLFSDVWRGSEVYDAANGSVRGWLIGLMHRRAADRSRHSDGEAAGSSRRSRPSVQNLQPPDQMGEGAQVRSSLERLPSQQRQVIELIYFRGMSIPDVSLRLGISAAATTARGVAAMRSLRDDLVGAEDVGPHPSRQAHE